MADSSDSRLKALLQGSLVTFLWSTSFIIIKLMVGEIPPVTFAGLRYTLAFLCLLPFALRRRHVQQLRALSRREWLRLLALGLVYYSVGQGAMFVGLSFLPSASVSLILNFIPAVVAMSGLVGLAERPAPLQWVGLPVMLAGAVVYFGPENLTGGHWAGIAVTVAAMFGSSGGAILGRAVNREEKLPPILVTVTSMGFGSLALLGGGLLSSGVPSLSPGDAGYLAWLAVVNGAFAFTLWNRTQRTLTALESSILPNTMLVQVAVLAWVFLGETIAPYQGLGMVLVTAGVLIVQVRGVKRQEPAPAA